MKKSMILAMLACFRIAGSAHVSPRRFSVRHFRLYTLWLLGGLLLVGNSAQAGLKAGDILVLDYESRAVVVVKPTTGHRRILSNFGDPAQGPQGTDLTGVAVGATGPIYVTELHGLIFAVDRNTGERSLVSDFSQGNIQGALYYGLGLDAAGRLFVHNSHRIFRVRVNPPTDHRVIVSDFENPAQGEVCSDGCFIPDLALQHARKFFVTTSALTDQIFRVNTVTGERRLVTDFGNPAQGPPGVLAFSPGLAVEATGHILAGAEGELGYLLFRIDPTTGNRTILSDFGNRAQGPRGINLHGMALEESGNIIVAAAKCDPTTGVCINVLFRVNPKTGQRVVFSNGNKRSQGPALGALTSIAVVPRP
jgi:hypothetical protein